MAITEGIAWGIVLRCLRAVIGVLAHVLDERYPLPWALDKDDLGQ